MALGRKLKNKNKSTTNKEIATNPIHLSPKELSFTSNNKYNVAMDPRYYDSQVTQVKSKKSCKLIGQEYFLA